MVNHKRITPLAIVYIVDDDAPIRAALRLMLEQEGMTVQVFASAEAFLALDLTKCRGCAIIDVQMPGMNGLQLQQVLCDQGILLPLIFLTGYGNIPMSVKAIKAGAEDFLTKPITREKLLAAVHTAFQKGEEMLAKAQQQQAACARLAELTEREREVMLLAVDGLANKDIARRLQISYRTVEHHKSSILRKTGTDGLLDLAELVQECGVLFG